MNRRQKLQLVALAAAAATLSATSRALAASVYFDDFNRATLNGGTSTYTGTITAGDGGILLDGSRTNTTANTLSLTNDATATANVGGIVHVSTPTSAFGGFNQTLTNNTGNLLTWTFNMQQIRPNPSGFNAGSYGAAFILGATDANFHNAGQGYALLIGNNAAGGGDDNFRLYKYTNGLSAVAQSSGIVTAAGEPILSGAVANDQYWSVRVVYNADTDEWSLATRNDAGTFANPAAGGGFVTSASVVDTTYTGVNLTHTGAYWAYATQANQTAKFDNFNLDVGAIPVAAPPRELTWDGDGAAGSNPSDVAGNWETAGNWYDGATHQTWSSINPDNATFGTGTGAGAVTVTVGDDITVGRVTFEDTSPTYTLSGPGFLTIKGDANGDGLIARQSANLNNQVVASAAQDWHINGAGTTVTMNGQLLGSGHIDKFGTGTLLLPNANPGRTGTLDIETGTVRVTSATAGITGLGTGITSVRSAATLHLDASGGPIATTSAAGQLFMGDGGTLRVSGNVTWQTNFPQFSEGTLAEPKSSTIQVDSGGTMLFRAQIRNGSGTVENFHTINVVGPGTVKLTNSGSNAGGDWLIYSGAWNVTGGMLVLGQNSETGGSSGDTLNALGFKNGFSGRGNTVTVGGTGVVVGTENAPNPSSDPVDAYKASVVMNGGTLASGNGKDSRWGGDFTTNVGTTSTIAVYDPLNPAVARNVSLTHGTDQGDATIQQGDTNWGGTLVIDPGATSGGAFNISREGGVVSVTPGASIQVNANAVMNLGLNQGNINGLDSGILDALSDGVDHVDVINNGTFNVSTLSKNVGAIDGTGNTTSTADVLNAMRVRQNSFTVSGDATIRAQANPFDPSAAAGVSKVNSMSLGGSSTLDITNNKLITGDDVGSWNGSEYTGVTGLIQDGRGTSFVPGSDPHWDGPNGIITSQSDATQDTLHSIGVAKGSDVLASPANPLNPLGATETTTWAGQTVSGDSTLVMYSWGGDTDLDGDLDGDDYFVLDSNIGQSGTVFGFAKGDVDYDGDIDGDDYFMLDSNIGTATAGGVFYTAGGAAPDSAAGLAAVPEPASLGVLGMAAAGLLRRRRRAN